MGVIRVSYLRSVGIDRARESAEWRAVSRGRVDEIVRRAGRRLRKAGSCSGCGYPVRTESFPALCVYCGHSLKR
jgi:rubrerythrin